jgi:hypothetical protein
MAKATVVKEIAIYGWAWREGYGVLGLHDIYCR